MQLNIFRIVGITSLPIALDIFKKNVNNFLFLHKNMLDLMC